MKLFFRHMLFQQILRQYLKSPPPSVHSTYPQSISSIKYRSPRKRIYPTFHTFTRKACDTPFDTSRRKLFEPTLKG